MKALLNQLKDAMFQKRTLYNAMVGGKIVTGCGDCPNNQIFPGLIPVCPTHKCIIIRNESNGDFQVIMDPFNVMESCPLKFIPTTDDTLKKEDAVLA